jgi:hypothetical protein
MNKPIKPNGRESGISQANISSIPGFGLRNRIDPDPSPFYINSADPDVKPDIPLVDRIQVDGDTPSPASSNKRSALSDSEDEVSKRVKASHNPPIPNSASDRTSQHTYHPHLVTPSSTSSPPTAHNAKTQTHMDNANSSSVTFARPAVPAIPVEGIETLQQASSDMIQTLVRRDAVDKEKQLMVAVGTMRTCLEIHFAPHMEAWRDDIRAPVVHDDRSHSCFMTSGSSCKFGVIPKGDADDQPEHLPVQEEPTGTTYPTHHATLSEMSWSEFKPPSNDMKLPSPNQMINSQD